MIFLVEPFGGQFTRISPWLVTRRKFQAPRNVLTGLHECSSAGCVHPEDMTLRVGLPKPVSVLNGDLGFSDTFGQCLQEFVQREESIPNSSHST